MVDDSKYRDNCVVLKDGMILQGDGTMRESSSSGYGVVITPKNEFEKARLIVQFWTMKTELAVAEFDERKQTFLFDVHQRQRATGNCGGPCVPTEEAVAVLNNLKAKATHCQEMLAESQEALELSTPSSVNKKQSISEQNRIRLNEFDAAIKQIEI